jgi:MFS family permease
MHHNDSGRTPVKTLPFGGKRPFYGWVVVGVGAVTQFFQGVTNQGFSSYLPFLQAKFGWSKALMAAPRSVSQVDNSILGPIEGYLVDKFGPRVIATIGIFFMGLGLILFGLTNSLWMYFIANIIIDIGTGFEGLLIMSVAVNNWFRRKRTLAQAIMLLGFSMAGLVGVPALGLVQTNVNWQSAAIGSGLIIWLFGFPCAQLLRTSPEPYGLHPDGIELNTNNLDDKTSRNLPSEYNFSLREAVRTPTFWFLAVGWALGGMGMGVAQTHLFLHLEATEGGVGLTHATATMVWSVASFSNIPCRLLGGILGDRLPKNILLGIASILMAVSVYILAMANDIRMAMAFAVIYGIGWGIRTPVMNAIQADYFGRRSLGKIIGWLQALSLPFTIAAPIIAGYVADIQDTYRLAFSVTALISLFGSVAIFMARQPHPPSDSTIKTISAARN